MRVIRNDLGKEGTDIELVVILFSKCLLINFRYVDFSFFSLLRYQLTIPPHLEPDCTVAFFAMVPVNAETSEQKTNNYSNCRHHMRSYLNRCWIYLKYNNDHFRNSGILGVLIFELSSMRLIFIFLTKYCMCIYRIYSV